MLIESRGAPTLRTSPATMEAILASRSGRHFLQIPGPTNVPERVLRAMDRALIDHRGPEFARLAGEIFDGLQTIFATTGPVLVFPGSGSGGWEAALVNTLSPGDRVLMFDQGFFADGWRRVAEGHGSRRLGARHDHEECNGNREESSRSRHSPSPCLAP